MRTGLWNDTPGNEGDGSTSHRFGRIQRTVRPWSQFIEKIFEMFDLRAYAQHLY
jgi:hypothetical protein